MLRGGSIGVRGTVWMVLVAGAVVLPASGAGGDGVAASVEAGSAGGVTRRVTVGRGGAQANNSSDSAAISAHGRYVAFGSDASNLVAGDTNGRMDVFVRDRGAHVTRRVSVGRSGAQANNSSSSAAISADGRYVAFGSAASNLVRGDTNSWPDVFVRDRMAHVTRRVSVGAGGAQANNSSSSAAISADGRYVAFISAASNLVPDDNLKVDVFVRDRVAHVTRRVSVGAGGAQANDSSFGTAISADGRYVAFGSLASNLVAGDTNDRMDVFVRDRVAHVTRRVSVGAGGAQANDLSFAPAISADGRYVAFDSAASNLVAGDTNDIADVYVRDQTTDVTQRVSVGPAFTQTNGGIGSFSPAISAHGRYVAFISDTWALVAGDTNDLPDVFVRDRVAQVTRRVSVGPGGAQANGSSDDLSGPAISAHGRYVAFGSLASNLVARDTNHVFDVFVRYRSG